MTSLLLLLMLGGSLGWAVSAARRDYERGQALAHVVAGCLASVVAGLIANGGTLFSGLGPLAYGAAVGATLVTLGLLVLLQSQQQRPKP